ncbi:MAG: AAA family ATPase [Acetobacteraceae bacterium]|nr:AAA family ATPase [Acetobacteraceae bacterium]
MAPAQKNLRLSGSGEALRRTFMGRPLTTGDVTSTSVYQRLLGTPPDGMPDELYHRFFAQQAYALQEIRLVVVGTTPKGIVRVGQETEVELLPEYVEPKETRRADVTYDDIGGLGDAVDQVREMVELSLRHSELFQRLGIDPPKGVILHGPPGTGKTLLAKAAANESETSFFSIAGPEIMGSHYGESEQRLRDIFQEAGKRAPSIIFIDEIDSLVPARGGGLGEPAVTERVVNTILAEMDGLEELQGVVVIGATNRPNLLDPALLRPGRFDELVYVPVPDEPGRLHILRIQTKGMPLAQDVDLEEIARRTQGYTGADLSDVVRRAGLLALRQNLETQEVGRAQFEQALAETRASITSEMEREYEALRSQLKQQGPTQQRLPIGFRLGGR